MGITTTADEDADSTVSCSSLGISFGAAGMLFDDLVLVKAGFWNKGRKGRLGMHGDVFNWVDDRDPMESFTFQATGLKKVWFTCEARTPENFCYQINFKIIQSDRYRFRDSHRESGSNVAVTKIMEALRTYFPRIVFGAPDNRPSRRPRARSVRPRHGSSGSAQGDAMREQEMRGKAKKIQGRVKEAVGNVTGNRKLEREGDRQQVEGAVQESVGKARRKVGEFVQEVAKATKIKK